MLLHIHIITHASHSNLYAFLKIYLNHVPTKHSDSKQCTSQQVHMEDRVKPPSAKIDTWLNFINVIFLHAYFGFVHKFI